MAKAEMKMPDDFLRRISRLESRTDQIVPRVLKAGADVLYVRVKGNLEAVIGRGTKYKSCSTGRLAAALGVSPAKLNRDGNHDVKIGFSEPRRGANRGGESNAKLANILEHGKHSQPPKPFLKPAQSSGRAACIETMKAKLEQEIRNI